MAGLGVELDRSRGQVRGEPVAVRGRVSAVCPTGCALPSPRYAAFGSYPGDPAYPGPAKKAAVLLGPGGGLLSLLPAAGALTLVVIAVIPALALPRRRKNQRASGN
jgi:hypothetical protein